jgi:hypothetical protein
VSIYGIPNGIVRVLREPRSLLVAVLFALTAGLAACGGGGGSSGSGNSNNSGSSGGTSNLPASPQQQPTASTAANTVPVTVAGSSVNSNFPNIPTVSVTICVAGTTTCQTIDNVQVDTASYGLRVLASALGSSFTSALTAASSNGSPLAECSAFADGYTWGSVRTADVKLAGETASAIPIQVIGDPATSTVPQACANLGSSQNSTQALGANGLLGIGVAPWDCGANCANLDANGSYYACPNGSNCSGTAVPLTQQVANPVAHFAVDNNGVILQMPPISNNGQASATGTLVFGIGTQSNNVMNATLRFATTQWGDLPQSTFNGNTLQAFLDSGSNGLFFNDSAIAQCGGNLGTFYCPATPLTLSATLTDVNNASGNVSFNVVSASVLLNNGTNFALNDLAGQFGSSANLDLGLPFFYGRYVYFGIGQTGTGGAQPYVAF